MKNEKLKRFGLAAQARAIWHFAFLLLPLAFCLLPCQALATDQFYINNGTVTDSPVIDAVNFINNGTFIASTTLPYDTSNTRNFTNNGTMSGSVGFRFDTAPSTTGTRKPAANFVNRLGGTVQGVDSGGGFIVGTNLFSFLSPSYLLVSATNIINEGLLAVGANGTMQLTGTNINLKRSGLGVNPISATGSFNGETNFSPDIAIYDENWGQTNMTFNSSSLISGFGIQSPPYSVQSAGFSFNSTDQVTLPFGPNTFFRFYTNSSGTIRQAIFVRMSDDPKLQLSEIGFSPGGNQFQTAAILLELFLSTNVVTGLLEPAQLYLADELLSRTNRGLLLNNTGTGTFRPANYLLSRLSDPDFPYASTFSYFEPSFFYDLTFTNPIVNAEYAGYLATVDNIVSRPPLIPAGTVSNVPGRITIKADNLDMTKTRVRGEGLIDIQANHLVGSSGASVDGESLSYTLGSTNGSLMFQNLAGTTVTRLKGTIKAWSAIWTNTSMVVMGGLGGFTTNSVEVQFHVLMVDASALTTTVPVNVYDFITHSTNLTVNDTMTIRQSMNIDARNFTLNGGITLSGDLQNWTVANTPNVRNFTNNGAISIPNEAHFGDDRTPPYSAFVNRGTITSFGQTINSDYAEITGINFAFGGTFTLSTRSGKIENGGTIGAAGDVVFSGDVLKLDGSTVFSGSRLDFNVRSNLFDLGGSSGNALFCEDGFRLLVKPASGDLLGTTIDTFAPNFASVTHVWAGANRGATTAGYSNNAAVGKLVLTPERFDPLFVFSGTGTSNAIYVDLLTLDDAAADTNASGDFINVQIDPNMKIYFADAIDGNGNDISARLHGKNGGGFCWVSNYVGFFSSITAVINGTTQTVNAGLYNSGYYTSGSGAGFDPSNVKLSVAITNSPAKMALVSWQTVANSTNYVYYKTSILSADWQLLTNFVSGPANGTVTVKDPTSPADRFYKVRVDLMR